MLDKDCITVSALAPDKDDFAVTSCLDWCTFWCRVIHTFVHAHVIQDWVIAHAKAGTDATEIDRGTQKGLTHGIAIWIVVIAAATRIGIANRLVGVILVDEFSCQDCAITKFGAIQIIFFIDN